MVHTTPNCNPPKSRRGELRGGLRMVVNYWELDVYKLAREGRQRIFKLSRCFPKEEMYSLTDQIRRSSRSVCAQITEAWGRRLYRADFINKLWWILKINGHFRLPVVSVSHRTASAQLETAPTK